MKKSIYIKNVSNYFIVLIVSLIASFLLTSFLFGEEQARNRESVLITIGEKIISFSQSMDDSRFNEYVKSLSMIPLNIYIYNQSELVSKNGEEPNEKTLSKKVINEVLEGNVYRASQAVGLPFEVKNERRALFLITNINEQDTSAKQILLIALFTVLFSGILLILLTTRYLVNPIVSITAATRELAKGNFNVHMNIHSQDEIGELANSFNFMVQELEQTEKMRRDFVANVSHEFQSPLTAIRGMVAALKDGMVEPNEEKLYLELIDQESERLSVLTKQLLNLSSLESKKHPFHPEVYRLDQQMRNLFVSMQSIWTEKQLEIDFDMPKIEVFADENLMSQVWTNLFSNAIKYNYTKGKITVKGHEDNGKIKILISNTGSGIPEKDMLYIFDRFYKVDKSHNRTINSYGLGLAVVKQIISLHKGNITVGSTEGKETTFMIDLIKNIGLKS